MKYKFFVIIPAYNEGKHIVKVIEGIKKYTDNIIVVDDGSTDNTKKFAQQTGVCVLSHIINLGKGAAIKTGYKLALNLGAKGIIFIDADNQHNSDDLPRFIDSLINKKGDLIIGSRKTSLNIPLLRFLGNKLNSFFLSLFFGVYVKDSLCGYRALSTKALKKMKLISSDYGIETEMIAKAAILKLKIDEIPIESIYLDKYKGVSISDAFKVFLKLLELRFFP